MSKRLVLGAGGHARQILSLYIDRGLFDDVHGFVEENTNKTEVLIHGKKVYDSSMLENIDPSDFLLMNGMGSPLRKRWIDSLEKKGFLFDTLVHPNVTMRESIMVGMGTLISMGVSMTMDITIGKHSIINLNSTVGHDSIIGDYVTVSPGSLIAGNVSIDDGVWIGIGTTIIEGIKIGENSFIGAGSVVVDNIPDNVLAYGAPAKAVRKISKDDLSRLI